MATDNSSTLGLLAGLAGTWQGTGYNLIAVPDTSVPTIFFRVITNQTLESTTFSIIGGSTPVQVINRSSVPGQEDITIYGLSYLQQINDAQTRAGIHTESGMWLNVPGSNGPFQSSTVVRQGSIPHGSNIQAQGGAFQISGGPVFATASPLPYLATGQQPPLPPEFLAPYQNGPFAPGINMQNLNANLATAIAGQNITNTIVIAVDTANAGSIGNIPFVQTNADATNVSATFWLETVQNLDGSTFLQLQYSQTVLLVFGSIVYPHISVATLKLVP